MLSSSSPSTVHSGATIAHASLTTAIGVINLFGTARGLLALALPNEPYPNAEASVRRLCGSSAATIREDEIALAPALTQLAAYFAGTLRAFDLPLDPHGTPFQRRVWDAVAAVPYGETRSYGEIARAIGQPLAVRAVGAANGANPLALLIPCHRVIGSDGKLHGYGGGLDTKRQLLALERATQEARPYAPDVFVPDRTRANRWPGPGTTR